MTQRCEGCSGKPGCLKEKIEIIINDNSVRNPGIVIGEARIAAKIGGCPNADKPLENQ